MTYVVCKGAVKYLARWAAFELAGDKIRVNSIIPGAYATPLWGDLVGASKDVANLMPDYLDELMASWQPFAKAGKPRDVAFAATYLGSDESAFVTGVALEVDGGLTLSRSQASEELFKGICWLPKRRLKQSSGIVTPETPFQWVNRMAGYHGPSVGPICWKSNCKGI